MQSARTSEADWNRICNHHVDLPRGQRLVERKIRRKGLHAGSLKAAQRLDALDRSGIQGMSPVFRRYRPVRRTDGRGGLVDRINGPPAPMTGMPIVEVHFEFVAKILAHREGAIGLLVLDILVQKPFIHAPNHEYA